VVGAAAFSNQLVFRTEIEGNSMAANPWDDIIPPETIEHYRRAGFGAPSRPGTHPALLVIDVQYATTGELPQPLAEGLTYHPMNCGESAWRAIPHIAGLVRTFRDRKLPILYPYVAPWMRREAHRRMPTAKQHMARHWEIVAEVAPQEEDILIPKTGPSAFFGTSIAAHLNGLRADTLFITGNTTSGCIRASVVDAYALNYKVIVPHECCYDRSEISHAVNLFDISNKYAEVTSAAAAIEMVQKM
jgi:maleamate amidohydrolase